MPEATSDLTTPLRLPAHADAALIALADDAVALHAKLDALAGAMAEQVDGTALHIALAADVTSAAELRDTALDALAGMTATTLAGVQARGRVLQWFADGDGLQDEIPEGIIGDLLRDLAALGAAPSLV